MTMSPRQLADFNQAGVLDGTVRPPDDLRVLPPTAIDPALSGWYSLLQDGAENAVFDTVAILSNFVVGTDPPRDDALAGSIIINASPPSGIVSIQTADLGTADNVRYRTPDSGSVEMFSGQAVDGDSGIAGLYTGNTLGKGNAGSIDISAGDGLGTGKGGDINISAGFGKLQTIGNGPGGNVNIQAGPGTVNGNLILRSLPTTAPGPVEAVWNRGGTLNIGPGATSPTTDAPSDTFFYGRQNGAWAQGLAISGNQAVVGPYWNILGTAATVGSGNQGTGMTISAGNGDGAGQGGNLSLRSGGGGTTGQGGDFTINSGPGNGKPGGQIQLRAGAGAGAGATGGDVYILAGDSSGGTRTGNITINTGTPSGGATRGNVIIQNLPTVNPGTKGALWINAGVLAIVP